MKKEGEERTTNVSEPKDNDKVPTGIVRYFDGLVKMSKQQDTYFDGLINKSKKAATHVPAWSKSLEMRQTLEAAMGKPQGYLSQER